mmetsp:Transcript_29308/g.67292  ORF Transcript_29308/g.67292 Transcript_29308/m.67292 type:complete len:477 (-) Transcript_29308:379-1809(-)
MSRVPLPGWGRFLPRHRRQRRRTFGRRGRDRRRGRRGLVLLQLYGSSHSHDRLPNALQRHLHRAFRNRRTRRTAHYDLCGCGTDDRQIYRVGRAHVAKYARRTRSPRKSQGAGPRTRRNPARTLRRIFSRRGVHRQRSSRSSSVHRTSPHRRIGNVALRRHHRRSPLSQRRQIRRRPRRRQGIPQDRHRHQLRPAPPDTVGPGGAPGHPLRRGDPAHRRHGPHLPHGGRERYGGGTRRSRPHRGRLPGPALRRGGGAAQRRLPRRPARLHTVFFRRGLLLRRSPGHQGHRRRLRGRLHVQFRKRQRGVSLCGTLRVRRRYFGGIGVGTDRATDGRQLPLCGGEVHPVLVQRLRLCPAVGERIRGIQRLGHGHTGPEWGGNGPGRNQDRRPIPAPIRYQASDQVRCSIVRSEGLPREIRSDGCEFQYCQEKQFPSLLSFPRRSRRYHRRSRPLLPLQEKETKDRCCRKIWFFGSGQR